MFLEVERRVEQAAKKIAKFVIEKSPNTVFAVAAAFSGSAPKNIDILSNPELISPPAIEQTTSEVEEEMVETGDPLWNPKFTGMWFPGHKSVATTNNPQITESLLVYGQATGDYGPYNAAQQKLDQLEQDADPTAGYCSITASTRGIFPQPSLKSTYYGDVLIDYKTKMGLLTALATRRAMVGFTNDPDQIVRRLNKFLDGTATWNFVVERMVQQDQEWFSVVNAVNSTSFKSDDFSNIAKTFSIASIQSVYEPYLPLGIDREPVNSNPSWIIPVDLDKVLAMVYGDDWVNVKQQILDKQSSKDFNRILP